MSDTSRFLCIIKIYAGSSEQFMKSKMSICLSWNSQLWGHCLISFDGFRNEGIYSTVSQGCRVGGKMSDSNSDLSKITGSWLLNIREVCLSTMAKKRAEIVFEISILLLSLDTWVKVGINLFIWRLFTNHKNWFWPLSMNFYACSFHGNSMITQNHLGNVDWAMTCKAVVITGSCVITKQRSLLLKRKRSSDDARFFKLKEAKFVAINGNRRAQQEFSVSRKVSKEIVSFQQAHVWIPILRMRCKNDSTGLPESDNKIRLHPKSSDSATLELGTKTCQNQQTQYAAEMQTILTSATTP